MRLSCRYFTFALLLFFNFEDLLISSVSAQITPDTTLPNNSSVNNQDNVSTITGGTQAGSNLFHSFEQFSVPTGGAAYFNNIGSIQNIISRVTGGSVSNIDGLLRANGTANLFLLNSNGIIFGSNASLNIGGSFLGSTASSIKFTDDIEFNAKTFQDKPLLSGNVPVGLNFTGNQGSINVKGTGHTQLVNATSIASFTQAGSGPGQSPNGLRLQPSKTIALIGGNVTFEGGVVTAPSGWIEVGSINSGIVKLTLTSARINFIYEAVNSFQDIQLVKQSLLDASGEFYGDIHIQGKNITFTDGSLASITNLKRFNPGAIRIDATETLDMTGITSFNVQPSLGTLKIVRGLNTATTSGKGADIIVSAKRVIGQGSVAISPITFGFGDSGDLIINSTESVEILGGATNETSGIGTVFGTVTYGAGKAGNVTLSTKRVHLDNGGTLQSLTFGKGGAGEVTVNASEFLKISGGQAYQLILRRTSNGLPDVANALPAFSPSSILSQSLSSGDAGDINVKTSQLTIENGGRLAASALVSGGSGNIKIDALNAVDVIGSGSVNQSLNPSTISSSVGTVDPFLNFIYSIRQAPTGSTGSVKISTGSLSLRDGGQVTVRNDGIGKGGELQINADSVKLDNQARITASAQSGQGGNIKIKSDDLLSMRRNSQISTSAGNAQAGGDGGQINIDTNFLIASPLENSDIMANAFSGQGGNVNILASAIFGLVPRSREELQMLLRTGNPNELDPSQLPSNDVTAISQTNPSLSGQVTFNTLDIGPRQALTNLPEQVVDVSGLIAQGCSGSGNNVGKRTGEFIITGRGGLPPQPGEPVETQARVVSNDTLEAVKGQRSALENTTVITPSSRNKLVEAQGWVFDEQGEMILTAQPPNATPDNSSFTQANCYAP